MVERSPEVLPVLKATNTEYCCPAFNETPVNVPILGVLLTANTATMQLLSGVDGAVLEGLKRPLRNQVVLSTFVVVDVAV